MNTRKTPKALYKSFQIEGNELRSPHTLKKAYDKNRKPLTLDNCKPGWTSRKLTKPLKLCYSGYHAGALRAWHGVTSFSGFKLRWPHRALFLVELHGTDGVEGQGEWGKWVGDSFTIVRRVA